jgi:hypothetical protein
MDIVIEVFTAFLIEMFLGCAGDQSSRIFNWRIFSEKSVLRKAAAQLDEVCFIAVAQD